ncbi:inosine/xanthosine triphosphatase [Chloroflexota bacterium]
MLAWWGRHIQRIGICPQVLLDGFERMFPGKVFKIKTVSTPSGVGDQPFSDKDTLRGAFNRANNAFQKIKDADFWVGIEGGVEPREGGLIAFAWIVVWSKVMVGKGRTGTFFLPPVVVDLIHQGKELGEADDIVFNRTDSKRENGAIGILTGDVINRAKLYEQGVILSLIPFVNPEIYTQLK